MKTKTLALFLVLAGAVAILTTPVAAQDGILTDTSGPIVYVRGPFTHSNVTNNIDTNGDPICDPPPLDEGCDDFLLQVAIPNEAVYFAANPTHQVSIVIGWVDSAEDFDLYVQDPGSGQTLYTAATSANPEIVILDQPVNGSYRIRVLLFAVVDETYTGTITLGPPPNVGLSDAGTYINNDGIEIWSCNTHLEGQALDGNSALFDHGQDGEPSMKITPNGINYLSAIAGLPAGSGLWRSTDVCADDYTFLGVPDGNLGGGDSDVEVGSIPNTLTGFYNVYTSSLTLANTTVTTSVDGGNTHAVSPYSNPTPTNDRQWNAAYGENTVYLSYRTLNTGNQLFVVRSDALGLPGTYTNGPYAVYADVVVDATLNTQLGNMVADNRPGAIPADVPVLAGPNGEGNVYHGFVLGGADVYVAVSQDFGVTWSSKLVFAGSLGNYSNIFTWVTVDQAGNVYTCFGDGRNVYYAVSVDQGVTWSNPVRVNNGVQTARSIMPTMAAGSDGRIVLAWYGTDDINTNSLTAVWAVFFARINNAKDALPANGGPGAVVVEQVEVSHGHVHTGIVCWGLGCEVGPNDRALLECFDIGVNPDGTSSILWGAFGDGGTRFTRQLNGNSSIAGMTIPDRSTVCPVPPDCDQGGVVCTPGEEAGVPGCDWCLPPGVLIVDDDSGDISAAGTNQHDIEAVFIGQPDLPDTSELVFTLEMAALAADPLNLPLNALWRVYFTNPDDFTSTGAQINYFVSMTTCDPTEIPSFSWGWVDTLTGINSTQGDLPPGSSFSANGAITLIAPRSLFSLGLGTEPQVGTTLTGIQGDVRVFVGANCTGVISQVDGTNSGAYLIQSECPSVTGIADQPAPPSTTRLRLAGANPFSAGTAFTYTLPEAGQVKVAVYNPAGQLVRTLFQGERPAGTHAVPFDTGSPGSELSAGVYFVRLQAADIEETMRVVHVK